ncbi:MAG: ABC transporter ATP-binding protein [Candidatus Bathyarchaeia archaeon]
MQTEVLKTINVTKRFGGLIVLNSVNSVVYEGEIVGLIGPNGAGKTTLFNVITGFLRPDLGEVSFKGRKISGLTPQKICKIGIARTFQIPKPFIDLTVLDNVAVAVMFGRKNVNNIEEARKEAKELLKFVGLLNKQEMLPSGLTAADLRKLEMCKALATNPELLLLDEVFAGLNPTEVEEMLELVGKINKSLNITVFMIEHVMKAVMSIAQRIFVLHYGEVIAEGRPVEIAKNEKVIEAYLGGRE